MNEIYMPFREVCYQKKSTLCQTQLAVMHKTYFDFNSTAICKLSSLKLFLDRVEWGYTLSDYTSHKIRYLLWWARDFSDKLDDTLVRYIQLPKDYFRPHSDSYYFGEVAFKQNGVMIVEADKLALCTTICKLKDWLVFPGRPYPLACSNFSDSRWCFCSNLLHAMWTDDKLRNFFEEQGIHELKEDINSEYCDQLEEVYSSMIDYCAKLITGEKMISRSNRAANVLASTQLRLILKEFSTMLRCLRSNMGEIFSDDELSEVFSDDELSDW